MISTNLLFITSSIFLLATTSGLLYPKDGLTREVKSLDGVWEFANYINANFSGRITKTMNPTLDLNLMPVPSSYNDVLTSLEGRDHLGPVAYERIFYVPENWLGNGRIWIRLDSVCYAATVYVNDKVVATHEIGHLPFEADITNVVKRKKNVVAVAVDNTLTGTTIPQGSTQTLPGGRVRQTYTFDFFNYAGIDRSVVVYHTPSVYISDIIISTELKGTTGIVNYEVFINRRTTSEGLKAANITYKISILDANEILTTTGNVSQGRLDIPNATLWWPYLMSDEPGYQYILKAAIYINDFLVDTYDQLFGIRVLNWDSKSLRINGKPVYLRGFGRHEDSDIRGKGLDLPLIIRDYNLIKWIGANSYRTSHYPYAEEIMDLADRLGIMIINEVPAVNTNNYNNDLLENHKRSLTELYHRDKNRPSVIMWSIANEPNTQAEQSKDYFGHVAAHIKSFDNTRPITLALSYDSDVDHAAEHLDIISFNKYEGWYIYTGQLDVIESEIIRIAEAWRKKHNKPVLLTEYGADTAEGLHILPTYLWSEEYQTALMSRYFRAFDRLRKEEWFVGEMIWNFADFKTSSDVKRVGLNKKGIFTRQRQPKNSAHFLRKRYWSLAHQLNNATLPSDLDEYVIDNSIKINDEL